MTARMSGRAAAGLMLVLVVAVSACTAVPPPPTPPSGGLAPVPPPGHPARPLLPVSYWKAAFDADESAFDAESRPLSLSPDSADHYTLAYSIDAFTSMFEATGEARYADVALDYADNVMATARPSVSFARGYDDAYLGWTTQEPDLRGQEVPLFESYCWRYITRLLRVLRTSPLYAVAGYRDRSDRLTAFAEQNVFDKWFSRGADDFIYRSRTHMAAHWAYIALDLSVVTTDPARRARYDEVVADISDGLPNYPSSLRGQLRPSRADPVAYWWSDVWGQDSGPGQDVSHGNGVIAFVVEARDLDAGWTAEDTARFSRTLTSFVLGRDDRYPEYVDGSGQGNGWIADGFVKLGRYDPAVQELLQGYGVQNTQYYAAMAVNAKILGANGTH
ncbi:MAG: hypothetical protein OJJ54_03690 [Pseudonocardia sp.]|nr:hypothetical protein [Pseudonocardia sp.]